MIYLNNTFLEGVAPGGLNNSFDIKVLICYLIDELNQPLSSDLICEIIQYYELANYFDIVSAISYLFENGQIITKKIDDEDFFELSNLGKSLTYPLFKSLPISVKQKAIESGQNILLVKKNIKHNKVNIVKKKDGYLVECKILDIGTDLLDIKLFVTTEKQANHVKNHFLKNSEKIYKNIIYSFDLI